MRRLDSLELDRAINEVIELVKEGRLTQEQGEPIIRAFFARGMTQEADDLFIESCQRLCRVQTAITVVIEEQVSVLN